MIKNFLLQTDYWDFLQFLTTEELGALFKGIYTYVRVYSLGASNLEAENELINKLQISITDVERYSIAKQFSFRIIGDIHRHHEKYVTSILKAKKGGKK